MADLSDDFLPANQGGELHPTSFFVIGVPLPTQEQQEDIPENALNMGMFAGVTTFDVDPEKLEDARIGVSAMIMTEVGPLPPDHPVEIHAPFADCPGATLYYPTRAGVKVGGYVMCHVDRVMCWKPPE